MPIRDEERKVAERIRLVRKEEGVTQRFASKQMWLTRDQLKRIEAGQYALPFFAGMLFCRFAGLNPFWLAFGDRESRFGFFDFKSDALHRDINQDPGTTFLQILEKHGNAFRGAARFFSRDQQISNPEPLGLYQSLYMEGPSGEFGARSRHDFRIDLRSSSQVRNVNELLTKIPKAEEVDSMKLRKGALWPELRERVLRLVRRRGMKTVLARDIGVSRQAITALLSRKATHGPSAEYALRLSKWVETAEAQQKESAGSVSETQRTRKIKK